MFRFAVPTILIGVAIAGFFVFTIPLYDEISTLKADVASYNEALDNSKTLEAERGKLTEKLNSIDPVNLVKLQKLLPDNVDNIRLILEIEKISKPYGMILKDVKYDTISKDTAKGTAAGAIQGGVSETDIRKDYGSWNLEFSTQGTYSNFINFIKDLESNLRIVDISSIQFSSDTGQGIFSTTSASSDSYKYGFKIKTYWLKN